MATNFLQESGFLVAPFNLMTTELNALASGANAISSVGGTSGVFTQTNFGSGIFGVIHFVAGGAFTVVAGGYIAGWFLYSPDSGSTFERVTAALDMPRSPDFVIPLATGATTTGDVFQSTGLVRLPWWSTKVYVGNRSGIALSASGHIIQCGPVAVQY